MARGTVRGGAALAIVLTLSACHDPHPTPTASLRTDAGNAIARGDHEAALRRYREVLERHPQSARARYDVGRTLLALGDPLAASEHLVIAHRLEPTEHDYTDLLAEAYLQARREDTLFRMLRREAEASAHPRDHLRLARFAARKGMMEEAVDGYRKAASLSRHDPTAHVELAALYGEMGEREAELRHLRFALYVDPGHEQARERVRQLGHVPGPSFALEPDLGGP